MAPYFHRWHPQIHCCRGDNVSRSSRGTVRKIGQLFSFIAAVLAATGRDLLNCGSSAVAVVSAIYCCRPALKGALTTYLSVDWFRNRSNEHPGITQQHTPDQYEGAGHEKKRWFSRRAAVKA